MMQVTMLRNERGSEDGVAVRFYEKDKDYEVGQALGSVFVKNGAAERTGGDDVLNDNDLGEGTPAAETVEEREKREREAQKGEQKSVPGAPENRNQKAPLPNKAPSPTPYQVGKVYEQDGRQFVAVAGENGGPAVLKPVTELTDEERKPLEASGQLKKA